MNKWMSSSTVALLCFAIAGCGDKESYLDWRGSLSPNNIDSFTKENPTSGGIMNELTRTKLKMAEMKSQDEMTNQAIKNIKQTFIDFNSVVLEFDRRKKSEGGSLEANQLLLDKISFSKAGMSHQDLTIAVNKAMQELDTL